MPLKPLTGVAATDLGLGYGGAALADQVMGETEEERRKRMQQMQDRSLMGPSGSPATLALFGRGLGGYGQ